MKGRSERSETSRSPRLESGDPAHQHDAEPREGTRGTSEDAYDLRSETSQSGTACSARTRTPAHSSSNQAVSSQLKQREAEDQGTNVTDALSMPLPVRRTPPSLRGSRRIWPTERASTGRAARRQSPRCCLPALAAVTACTCRHACASQTVRNGSGQSISWGRVGGKSAAKLVPCSRGRTFAMYSSSGWYIHTFSSSRSSLVTPLRGFFFFGGTCDRSPASATIACSRAAFGSSSRAAVDERKTRERKRRCEKW